MKRILNWGLIAGLVITLAFMGGCAPAQAPEGGFNWTLIIFLVLIFGIFYLLSVRPRQKRQKEVQEMTSQLRKGDKVITIGGIYGEIESISQDSVVLKVESGATIRVARTSIAGKRQR